MILATGAPPGEPVGEGAYCALGRVFAGVSSPAGHLWRGRRCGFRALRLTPHLPKALFWPTSSASLQRAGKTATVSIGATAMDASKRRPHDGSFYAAVPQDAEHHDGDGECEKGER